MFASSYWGIEAQQPMQAHQAAALPHTLLLATRAMDWGQPLLLAGGGLAFASGALHLDSAEWYYMLHTGGENGPQCNISQPSVCGTS